MPNYRGGFECHKCPQSADPEKGRACPAWWEVAFTNSQNGELKVEKACAYLLMPRFLIEVIKASNRPAAEISKMANSIVEGLDRLEQRSGPTFTLHNPAAGLSPLSIGAESRLEEPDQCNQ